MRRSHRTDPQLSPSIRFGDLEINLLKRTVSTGGHEIHLTGVEESLLYLLAGNAGRVLSRDEILEAVWGEDYAPESNLVDTHIKLPAQEAPEQQPGASLHFHGAGEGYCFRSWESTAPSA